MALLSTASRSNWNLEMLVFVEGGKPEYPEKNPRSRDEDQQQTHTETGNRTQATLVGGECSHHCAIPAPTYKEMQRIWKAPVMLLKHHIVGGNHCLLKFVILS